MTYYQTKKEIDRLTALLNQTYTTEIPYLANKTRCVGHGMFMDTDEVCVKYNVINTPIYRGQTRQEIEKQIKILKDSIADEEEKRRITAKLKRYKKELETLNKRKAYLEKWIAENEEI